MMNDKSSSNITYNICSNVEKAQEEAIALNKLRDRAFFNKHYNYVESTYGDCIYDFERNLVELGLIRSTTPRSAKVYWICTKHNVSFLQSVITMKKHINSSRCPKCIMEKRRRSLIKNTGSLNDWCKENGERGAQILNEYSQENEFTADEITWNSSIKVNWICEKGHKWDQIVSWRTKEGVGNCPVCRAAKSHEKLLDNNGTLLDWCKANKEWGERFISEWDTEKNELTPSDVTVLSPKKVYWKCSKCGHSYETAISNKTTGNKSCPNCGWNTVKNRYNKEAGKKVISGENDLLSQRPELCKEWDYEKNDKLPSEMGYKSTKKAWWRCVNCNWSWNSIIASRSNGTRCPNCWYSWIAAENGQPQKLKETYEHQNTTAGIQIKPEDF